MALSGTYYGPWLGDGYHRVYMDWSATQDIGGNTSTVTAVLKWQSTGFSLSSSTSKNVSITIAGTVYTGTATAAIGAGATKTLLTASKTVAHNTDGTLTIDITGWFELKYTLGGYYYNSTTASGSPALNSIPRASLITSFPNFTIGSGVTVYATRNSTSFTNTYSIYVGGTWITDAGGQGDSFTFSGAQLAAIYAHIPSATTVTVTAYVSTWSGGTQIGSTQSANATGTVGSDIIPSLSSVTAAETVTALVGVITAGQYLQNYSKIRFTINGATGGAGTSDTLTYNIDFNGVDYTSAVSTTGLITATGALTATATVTDSRGRVSASKTVVCALLAFPSNISSFGAFTISSGITATKGRAHSALTTEFILKVGTTTIKSVAKALVDSYTFTAADVFGIYALIPSDTTATTTLTVNTYAGTTIIDTKTATATASVGSTIIPVVTSATLTATEQNATTLAMALGANNFVQGKSTIKLTAAGGVGINSSTISSYEITLNGSSYVNNAITGTISSTGALTATVTATDSRGRVSAGKNFTLTFIAYAAPTISTFTAVRNATTATTVNTSAIGAISSVSSKNQLTYTIKSKLKTTGTWTIKTGPTALAIGTASLSTAPTYTLYDATLSYDFLLEVTDKYGTVTTSTTEVGTERVTMSWGKYGIGVGKVYEQGALDVAGDVFVDGLTQSKYKAISIGVGADLNDYNDAGFYTCPASATAAGLLNCPTVSAFSLFVEQHAGTKQTVTVYSSGDITTWIRNRYTSTWGTWRKVWNGVGDSINTDTVDGMHASDFAPVTHAHGTYDRGTGIMTGGAVLSQLVISNGIVTAVAERTLTSADIGAAASAHAHTTFDRASAVLSGANVFSNVTVTDGITTAIATRALTPADIGAVPTQTVTFINATLQNGWVQFPSWGHTTGYYKDQFGFVHLRGVVKSGTASVIFTLPAGYRPISNSTYPIISGTPKVVGAVDVQATGGVYHSGGSTAELYLEGVTFYAGN